MSKGGNKVLRLGFDRRLRPAFHGANFTRDGGLLCVIKAIRHHPCHFALGLCVLTMTISCALIDVKPVKQEYKYRFVLLSDSQPTTEETWQRMANAIDTVNGLEPDIVLFAGDITAGGSEREYIRARELLGKIQAPLYAVPGNHDTIIGTDDDEKSLPYDALHARKIALYNEYIGEDAWSVELGDFQFIGFDSTEVNQDRLPYKGYVYEKDLLVHGPFWPYISNARSQWLLETCRNSPRPYKFLVTHYPSVCHRCILSHQSDRHGRTPYPIQRDHIDTTLGAAGVIGQMFGHRHLIEAGRDPHTSQLMFDSCSAVHHEHGYGVMYFDVYENVLDCFWKPVGETPQPMGSYNLDEIRSGLDAGSVGLDPGARLPEGT